MMLADRRCKARIGAWGLGVGGALLVLGGAALTLGPAAAQGQEHERGGAMIWSAFGLEELRAGQARGQRPYHKFIDEPTLSTGLYAVPAGGEDHQEAHRQDEVYFIISGRATLVVDGERRSSKAGDVIFVSRGIDHRFEEIEEDLEVLVFFSKAGGESISR